MSLRSTSSIEAAFKEWRKTFNAEILTERNLFLMQPKNHFFDRLEERKVDVERAEKIIKNALLMYSKRIFDTCERGAQVEFTIVAGDLRIPLITNKSDRCQGHVENGKPTYSIVIPTISWDNNRGQARDRKVVMKQVLNQLVVPY